MYELSACEPPIRKAALRLASKGVRVTRSMAKQLIDAHSDKPKAKAASAPPPAIEPEADDSDPFEDGAVYEDVEDMEDFGEEPAPDFKDELDKKRRKAVATAQALIREVDDLQELKPKHEHKEAIHECKRVLAIVGDWK